MRVCVRVIRNWDKEWEGGRKGRCVCVSGSGELSKRRGRMGKDGAAEKKKSDGRDGRHQERGAERWQRRAILQPRGTTRLPLTFQVLHLPVQLPSQLLEVLVVTLRYRKAGRWW